MHSKGGKGALYLHLGQDTVVCTQEIVGIFDLDAASLSAHTRAYLSAAQKAGGVAEVSQELPKSFIVMAQPPGRVYISPIRAATLLKRSSTVQSLFLE